MGPEYLGGHFSARLCADLAPQVTTDRLLLERLETDFLSALGLLGPTSPFGDVDVAGFHKKMVRRDMGGHSCITRSGSARNGLELIKFHE